ncbi:bifunctional adenosylcobinamide kinase/adenosylcobinamide-phosphate guanylyltransferase [Natroniella sulfidigena]|uniref:bifunctional adenosylcobinamide kinase/adenosylcobinamide-phosphate guanylyltransferase n=1 Tax=Natroniella sulfidigena TaxID=723921 RepID=UPI00200AB388|nr:bifunctional adenosylcobinamide kinase/adenosylcobinamide-phosphate guanylyltransferase [Natroniella sulfidigena]MCK8817374.1 bifunctional adenosylcobinamide kinase/adenosylcobinamide-phosphate guanylyltransferase [Natroniella sulfidigena]
MSKLILVLGGARSGKSSFAEDVVENLGGQDVIYVATSEVRDEEMKERIIRHRQSRPQEWRTIEESKLVSQALTELEEGSVVLLDCLTVLLSNLVLADSDLAEDETDFTLQAKEEEILAEVEQIIEVGRKKNLELVIVSNEVGQGVVPSYKLGRVYRDLVGWANQRVAAQADEVYITYAGLPVEIKELGIETREQFRG